MDFSKKQIAIFYIEKNKGVLYRSDSDKPLAVSFPQDAVNNLEIVDKNKFERTITNFITKNELKPTNVYVILSKHITFEKETKDVPLSLQNAETENFLEMVPFHQILSRTYNFSNKTIIVAADRDLCESLVKVFQENQFSVPGIIPLSILQEKLPKLEEEFDGKLVLQKISNLKQYFLPLGIETQERTFTYDIPSFKNPKFLSLIGVFVILLAILGVMLYFRMFSSVPMPKQNMNVKIYSITPTVIASPSATLTPIDKKN